MSVLSSSVAVDPVWFFCLFVFAHFITSHYNNQPRTKKQKRTDVGRQWEKADDLRQDKMMSVIKTKAQCESCWNTSW